MRNLLEAPDYEPHFSGHETFPLRQMWLKKAIDQQIEGGTLPKSTFSGGEAIALFGVGKNMVSSIKHWALACGALEETADKSTLRVNSMWATILAENGLDPYCENPATTWLAHWRLAGSPRGKHRSTTWWWLFNNVSAPVFTREDVIAQLQGYAQQKGARASEVTIRRDVEACLRGYCPKADGNVEDVAEPMLAEIGLVLDEGKGSFTFRRGPKASLPDGLFDLVLLECWDYNAPAESSLAFEAIAYGPGSPGRVFKLDEDSLAERLFGLEGRTGGVLAWTDSAGIRQVMQRPMDAEAKERFASDLLRAAYA